jgi:hypothetical protein
MPPPLPLPLLSPATLTFSALDPSSPSPRLSLPPPRRRHLCTAILEAFRYLPRAAGGRVRRGHVRNLPGVPLLCQPMCDRSGCGCLRLGRPEKYPVRVRTCVRVHPLVALCRELEKVAWAALPFPCFWPG